MKHKTTPFARKRQHSKLGQSSGDNRPRKKIRISAKEENLDRKPVEKLPVEDDVQPMEQGEKVKDMEEFESSSLGEESDFDGDFLEEEDEEEEEEKNEAVNPPQTEGAKVTQPRRTQESVPSSEEIARLKETEELFHSNLFRLQAHLLTVNLLTNLKLAELHKEIAVDYTKTAPIEHWLHKIKDTVDTFSDETVLIFVFQS